jgi:hypothetical protein
VTTLMGAIFPNINVGDRHSHRSVTWWFAPPCPSRRFWGKREGVCAQLGGASATPPIGSDRASSSERHKSDRSYHGEEAASSDGNGQVLRRVQLRHDGRDDHPGRIGVGARPVHSPVRTSTREISIYASTGLTRAPAPLPGPPRRVLHPHHHRRRRCCGSRQSYPCYVCPSAAGSSRRQSRRKIPTITTAGRRPLALDPRDISCTSAKPQT